MSRIRVRLGAVATGVVLGVTPLAAACNTSGCGTTLHGLRVDCGHHQGGPVQAEGELLARGSSWS